MGRSASSRPINFDTPLVFKYIIHPFNFLFTAVLLIGGILSCTSYSVPDIYQKEEQDS